MAPVPIRNLPQVPPPKLDNTTTDIPLGIDGGLPTQRTVRISWEDLQGSIPGALPVATIADLKAKDENLIQDGQSIVVLEDYSLYIYQASSTDPDNGNSVLKPDFITLPDPGRYHSFSQGGCDDYSRIMTDTNGQVLTTQNGFVASAPCA